MVVPFPWKPLL